MPPFVRAPRPLTAPERVELTASQRATTHMAASLLLDYPVEDSLSARLEAVTAALVGPAEQAHQIAPASDPYYQAIIRAYALSTAQDIAEF